MTLARHGRAIHACPPEPSTLILRSSAAASRRRIQCSLEAPSSFETAERPPQDEAWGGARHFHPPHVMAVPDLIRGSVPVIPDLVRRGALSIGITSTSPVM